MKNILIIGGNGYIGSNVAMALNERGYNITIHDFNWFGNTLFNITDIKQLNQDEKSYTVEQLKIYDTIIYLGGFSNDPMAEYNPYINFIFNTTIPTNLALIAKKANVKRFIYASSCSVYSYINDKLSTEDIQLKPQTPYGISKIQAEDGIVKLMDNNFSVICLRKGTVSGYSKRMRFDLVINSMFKNAITENIINVDNPSLWRPLLGMNDAVNAYILAVEAEKNISGIFNIASDNYTIGSIGSMVKNEFKNNGIKVKIIINNHFNRNYKVDTSKAKTMLGFHPVDNINTIIYDLFKHNNEFTNNYNNDIFYNIQTFKNLFS